MNPISLDEARERLPELLEEGANGDDILIARGDGATYRIAVKSVEPPRHRRTADLHAGLIEVADDFDEELPDGFWFGDEGDA